MEPSQRQATATASSLRFASGMDNEGTLLCFVVDIRLKWNHFCPVEWFGYCFSFIVQFFYVQSFSFGDLVGKFVSATHISSRDWPQRSSDYPEYSRNRIF